MRSLLLSVALVAVLLSSGNARAEELTDQPWSVGFLLGFSTVTYNNVGTFAAFSMEIPVEYTVKVASVGFLVPHFGFELNAGKGGAVNIVLPLGIRYKFRIASVPLYIYPLFDIGPAFDAKSGTAFGALRVGAGLSYYVHKYVELIFQPLGLGAIFNADGGAFMYNFLLGLNVRF